MTPPFSALLLDLDGTVYRGSRAVPGAAAFLRKAEALDVRVLFLTNRSTRTPETVADHLTSLGIPTPPGAVLTSALATAHLLEKEAPGAKVFFVGEEGLARALASSSLRVTDRDPDYVVVGFDSRFDYAKLTAATRWVRAGARLVATNPDRVLNTDQGLAPGNGALVAAVEAAANARARVVGKPERPIFDAALERLGCSPGEVLVVGDNLETDIAGGVAAGLETVLLLTGVSTRADVEELAEGAPRPHHTVDDFSALEAFALREG